ncbi:MAG: lipid kinase [Bacteroidaceae bacterium]|nr:lipid kinase [Bacteroidaceae bacterium]
MENERWGIIYCPKQGVQRSHKRWERIREYLTAREISYDFVQSEGLDSVSRLTTMLAQNGYRTIIIVGGDSALNLALNSILALGEEARNGIALGVIPNGRGNDWATFWGFDDDNDEQTVEWLAKRRLRKVDVGFIREKREDAAPPQYFLNCINVGLVANIMNIKHKTRQWLVLRGLSYALSMVLLLFQRMETKMHLKVNEDEIHRRLMSLCIGSARGYGLTPSAVPYNGMLDVSTVSHPAISQLLGGTWLLLTGRILNHRNVRSYRTSRPINIFDTGHAPITIDGRATSVQTPFEVDLKKEYINFIIPS